MESALAIAKTEDALQLVKDNLGAQILPAKQATPAFDIVKAVLSLVRIINPQVELS